MGDILTFEKLAKVSKTALHYNFETRCRVSLFSVLTITTEGSTSLSFHVIGYKPRVGAGWDGPLEETDFETQSLSAAIRHYNNFMGQ